MPNRKVIQFPMGESQTEWSESDGFRVQSDLFGHGLSNPGFVTFLPVAPLAEHTLLFLVARNGVRTIFDLRPRPVFDRPQFNHQRVVANLFHNGVAYFDIAADRELVSILMGFQNFASDRVRDRVDGLLSSGISIGLYNDEAKSLGWVDRFRQVMRLTNSFKVEFHPRGLVSL